MFSHKQVDPKSPDFHSKHASTVQLLSVDVSNLKAQLEQSAILGILAFVEQLNYKLSELALPAGPATEEIQASLASHKPAESHADKIAAEPVEKSKTKALGSNEFRKVLYMISYTERSNILSKFLHLHF